jgi:hypothetical protein
MNKEVMYGEDNSERTDTSSQVFFNSLGDLKKNIEYLIGSERNDGFIGEVSPEFIAAKLNVSVEVVRQALNELQK